MALDSWSLEAIAVCFSISCFVAILCVLQLYNGKQSPQLPKGVSLNTIVSVLATASKSSLMFVAGECIAQLRWVLFRKSHQPLSYIQSCDSASRGPWGSLTILLKDKCRSLVTIGALVVLLAMAFDPFIQQIIDYPVLPTQHQSKTAQVVQSRYLLPPVNTNKEFVDAINGGILSDSIDPNYIPVNVSILDGMLSSYSISFTSTQLSLELITHPSNGSQVVGPILNYKQYLMTLPKYLYWIIDTHVTASAELDIPEEFSTNISTFRSDLKGESTFLSDLMDAIKVAKATECAFSICAKEYAISVQSGDSSIKIVDEDFGSLYTASSTTSPAEDKLCWKPNSSPMTNWNTTGQADLDKGLWRVMDPANFEFCGVEPKSYYESLVALVGNMSMELNVQYSNETENIPWFGGNIEIQDMVASSVNIQRATYIGLEMLMTNIAFSVSALARKMSNNPIYGVVTSRDSYVVVRWQWLTVPAVLLVAGTLLLIVTALISTRGGVHVWKSSTLPLMFHGLDRNIMIEHGQCETVSEMEQVADGIKVDLGISSEERTMLRGTVPASQMAQNVIRRPSRRRSF
ncbi:uncharacterized protein N7483_007660 [Penicillium malachiteum]|uniref:uncharacterized protein n=1 Tax=Penicillium malachiteum TaxID=1324776 RepID=UPI0025484F10|nr:uncharacterized protein N7483_007660 [Penicillium malachiteum]KAJ5726303.1 hypothetical protein N7483_007660 [Penicillium malachiteum]